MTSILRTRVFGVWVVLIVVTVLSWCVGATNFGSIHQVDEGRRITYSSIVLVIAFVKIWLVMRYFMEARLAPRGLRIVCDVWLLAVAATIVSFYPLGLWA